MSLTENLAAVHAKIERAATAAGRDPADVRLLPVSKTVPAERLRQAQAAGLNVLGENKVQELVAKARDLEDLSLDWALIGHLQTNKARDVARYASEFHALDRHRAAAALDRRLQALGRELPVYVQVNTSGEASKFGLDPEETLTFLSELHVYSSLRVEGLMTLAKFTGVHEEIRECFRTLRTLRDEARQRDLIGAGELSMGMSGDYELAIEEGATCVRVGQAIFGPRDLPDSHYWPGAS